LTAFDRGRVFAHGVQRVDIGARLEKDASRLSLLVERNAWRWNGHQRRSATGQQHKEPFIGSHVACGFERLPARGKTTGTRLGMLARNRPKPRIDDGRRWSDHHTDAERTANCVYRRAHHCRRCLSDGNHRDSGAVRPRREIVQRPRGQRVRIGRTDTCLDDRQQICSKLLERLRQ
jgi:hypothetical protein